MSMEAPVRLMWSVYALVRIGIDGLNNSILSDLVLRYSPEYYVFLANGSNVVFNNFDISGFSSSDNEAKNTDAWDTYRSTDVTIMNSVINNGDGKSTFTPPFSLHIHVLHRILPSILAGEAYPSPPYPSS